jgi:hypothetical protein
VCADRESPDADALAHRAEPDARALADRAKPDARARADRAVPDPESIAHRHEPDASAQARPRDIDRVTCSDGTSAFDADALGSRRAVAEPANGTAAAGADRYPFGARSGARETGRTGNDVDRRHLFDGGARRRV